MDLTVHVFLQPSDIKPCTFETPILKRIAEGDLSVIDEYNMYSLNLVERIGFHLYNPLTVASLFAHFDIIRKLINIPAIIKKVSEKHDDSLSFISCYCSFEIINRLLDKDENDTYEFPEIINRILSADNHVLYNASRDGSIEFINRLLTRNNDGEYEFPEVIDNIAVNQNSIFIIASSRGHVKVIDRLLARNNDGSYEFSDVVKKIAERANAALKSAVSNGHIDVVNRLLARKDDGSYEFPKIVAEMETYDYGLLQAIQNGHIQVVNRLLAEDNDNNHVFPVINQVEYFNKAAEYGQTEILNRLLSKNSDGSYEFPQIIKAISLNDYRTYGIRVAIFNNHVEVIKRLLSRNSNDTYEFPTLTQRHRDFEDFVSLRISYGRLGPYHFETAGLLAWHMCKNGIVDLKADTPGISFIIQEAKKISREYVVSRKLVRLIYDLLGAEELVAEVLSYDNRNYTSDIKDTKENKTQHTIPVLNDASTQYLLGYKKYLDLKSENQHIESSPKKRLKIG